MKILKLLPLIILIPLYVNGHSGKPDHHVIIDTDGGLDDMRAITMLLSNNNVRVMAIICSQGILSPDSVYVKVKSLLSTYHHEGIRIAMAEKIISKPPQISSLAAKVNWGNPIDKRSVRNWPYYIDLLNNTTKHLDNGITLIALGSLKTYAIWLKSNPEITNKIDEIIWYNEDPIVKGFNYRISPESFETIKKSNTRLQIITNKSDKFFVDNEYIKEIGEGKSVYAKQIKKVFANLVSNNEMNVHLKLWDDLVPLFMEAPILFDQTGLEGNIEFFTIQNGLPEKIVNMTILEIMESSLENNNRVFKAFPTDSLLYRNDYAGMIKKTIDNFGLIEWKAIALTNEIHGHTGIYSIIGAKMGIRAMEYFNVGINNMTVTTFAGNNPPKSCLNDGIQISTGCTIGQGLIVVSDSVSSIPSAIFECNGQKVLISVKDNIALQMQNDIKHGTEKYGLASEDYWLYIENLAIKYWRDFSRYEIFDIQKERDFIVKNR